MRNIVEPVHGTPFQSTLSGTVVFGWIAESLSTAPPDLHALVRSVDRGNAHALWTAVKQYHDEARGVRASTLLRSIVTAAQAHRNKKHQE